MIVIISYLARKNTIKSKDTYIRTWLFYCRLYLKIQTILLSTFVCDAIKYLNKYNSSTLLTKAKFLHAHVIQSRTVICDWKMSLFRFLGLTLIDNNASEIKSLRVINLIWMGGSVSVFVYLTMSPTTHIFTRNFTHMSDVIEFANYLFVLATHLVILLHIQMVNGKNILWHTKLRQVDGLLSGKHDMQINHDVIKRWNLTKAMIILTCTVACSFFNVQYALQSTGSIFLLSAHNYALKTIINLRYIQNALRVDLLKEHFLAYQNAIHKIVERNHTQWKLVFVLDKFNRQHNPMKKIDDKNDILIFKRMHAILYESTKLLENCFGWSLLAMISFTFIDLTSNLYWFFIAYLNLEQRFNTLDCILEIIPSIISVSCLFYSSFDAGRKAKEGNNFVIELYTGTTSEYNVMVKEFLMQTYHERIENSANDFFLVDFKVLPSVSKYVCLMCVRMCKINCAIYVCVMWFMSELQILYVAPFSYATKFTLYRINVFFLQGMETFTLFFWCFKQNKVLSPFHIILFVCLFGFW